MKNLWIIRNKIWKFFNFVTYEKQKKALFIDFVEYEKQFDVVQIGVLE